MTKKKKGGRQQRAANANAAKEKEAAETKQKADAAAARAAAAAAAADDGTQCGNYGVIVVRKRMKEYLFLFCLARDSILQPCLNTGSQPLSVTMMTLRHRLQTAAYF